MNFFKKIFKTEESEKPTIDDKTSTKACIALLLETSMADEVLDESEFDEILKEYAGKESLLSAERKNLSNLSNEDKKVYGETLNNVNKSIVTNIKKAKEEFINNKYASLEDEENEDITIDWITNTGTHRHILSQVMDEVVNIFASIGYKVAYGPEVETSWHNFDALNLSLIHI